MNVCEVIMEKYGLVWLDNFTIDTNDLITYRFNKKFELEYKFGDTWRCETYDINEILPYVLTKIEKEYTFIEAYNMILEDEEIEMINKRGDIMWRVDGGLKINWAEKNHNVILSGTWKRYL